MTRRIILVDIGAGLTLAGVLPSVALFADYSAQLKARGGQAPYTYTVTTGAAELTAAGLQLDPATGIISGTAGMAGTIAITVRVTDLSGAYVERGFIVTVIAEPLSLSGAAPLWTVGTPYSYTYTAAHGVPPYTWSIASGSLPAGLTLGATGEISGTPTAGNAPAWTVRVTDSAGASIDLRDNATLQLLGDFADATVGTAYSSDLLINGGDAPYSNPRVTVGALPAGLALSIVGDKLRLSGTPTAVATSSFTAAVDSTDGQTATSAQSVTLAATSTAYRDAVLADAPLHYYRLNETTGTVLVNSGTSGVDGTYATDASNWTASGLVTGDTNKGILIPTTTINYDILNPGAVTNTDFTFEVIIQPEGVSGGGAGVIWSYGPAAANCPGIDIEDVGAGQFKLRYMRVGTAVIFRSAAAYAWGTKLHVVIRHTRSSHLCEMFIKGVKETATGTFTASTTTYGMKLFNQNFPPYLPMYGKADEAAYYNYLLSDARIAAHAALV